MEQFNDNCMVFKRFLLETEFYLIFPKAEVTSSRSVRYDLAA